jgi:hypothetical protein
MKSLKNATISFTMSLCLALMQISHWLKAVVLAVNHNQINEITPHW